VRPLCGSSGKSALGDLLRIKQFVRQVCNLYNSGVSAPSGTSSKKNSISCSAGDDTNGIRFAQPRFPVAVYLPASALTGPGINLKLVATWRMRNIHRVRARKIHAPGHFRHGRNLSFGSGHLTRSFTNQSFYSKRLPRGSTANGTIVFAPNSSIAQMHPTETVVW